MIRGGCDLFVRTLPKKKKKCIISYEGGCESMTKLGQPWSSLLWRKLSSRAAKLDDGNTRCMAQLVILSSISVRSLAKR